MKKLGLAVLAAIFLFLVFPVDVMADDGGKSENQIPPLLPPFGPLEKEAESLRAGFLKAVAAQDVAGRHYAAILVQAREMEIVCQNFFQEELENILQTRRNFFWSRKEATRKNFFEIALDDFPGEITTLKASVAAASDAAEFFEEQANFLGGILEALQARAPKKTGGENPVPSAAPQPSALKPASIGVVADPAPDSDSVAKAERLRKHIVALGAEVDKAIEEFALLIERAVKEQGYSRQRADAQLKATAERYKNIGVLVQGVADSDFSAMTAEELTLEIFVLEGIAHILGGYIPVYEENKQVLKKMLKDLKKDGKPL